MPCILLIDQNGKIEFKGYPTNRTNLEQYFDDLLAGKEITWQIKKNKNMNNQRVKNYFKHK